MLKRTFKFRLYPNKEQEKTFKQWLNTCRSLYNDALAERKQQATMYMLPVERNWIGYKDQAVALTDIKKNNTYFSRVHSQVLQDVLRRLDKAFQNFFRRVKNGEKPGYPRFKGENRYDSFTYPQNGFTIDDNRLYLSKIGLVKVKLHRPIEGTIKTCTIGRDVNQWYVCFSVETDDIIEKKEIKIAVGIDLGLNDIITLSNGDKVENPKWLMSSEKKLAKEQKRLARKKKESRNREKQRTKVAKVHRKIRNQRADFYHKLSRKLVDNYDMIVFENLNINGMMKNHHFAKSIGDASWSQLISFARYKAEDAGAWMELVDPKRTSQLCSGCGKEVPKSLSIRIHRCPFCDLIIDRDENAAKNILSKSTAGTAERACKSYLVGEAMKQEAILLVRW